MLPNPSITETMTPAEETIPQLLNLLPKQYTDTLLRGRRRSRCLNLKPQAEHLALAGFQPFFTREGHVHATAVEICNSAGVPRTWFYRHASALWTGPRRLLDRSERMSIRYDGVRCYVYTLRKVAEHWTQMPPPGETNETTRAEESAAPQSESGPSESINLQHSEPVSTASESVRVRRSESINLTRAEYQIDTFDHYYSQKDTKKNHKKRERAQKPSRSLCFRDLSEAEKKELLEHAREMCLSKRRDLSSRDVFGKFEGYFSHEKPAERRTLDGWKARLGRWIVDEKADSSTTTSTGRMERPRQKSGFALLEERAEAERAAKRKAMWGSTSETLEQAKLRKGARGIAMRWTWLIDAMKAEKEPLDAFDRCFHEWEAMARGNEFDSQDAAAADLEPYARHWIKLRAENRRRTRELKKKYAS